MYKNYVIVGPPRNTSTPSKLSLYLATITYNSFHAPSNSNDILHQIIAFFAIKISFLSRWVLIFLIALAASWRK
jgi:hypothetical protein